MASFPYYEIALPLAANDGADYAQALTAWEASALSIAGGFTRRPDGEGTWQDPKDGTVYRDTMRSYRIACTAVQFDALVALAFELFPDQVGLFTAQIGTATIYDQKPTTLRIVK